MVKIALDMEKTYAKLIESVYIHKTNGGIVMLGLNRVQIIGRLGKNPESRFIPSGKKVCSFTVAVDRQWKSSSGEIKKATDWFNVEAWGRLGEICQDFLSTGRLVYIEGRLQTDRYEVDGETRSFTKVIASKMIMLDKKPDEADPDVIETETD